MKTNERKHKRVGEEEEHPKMTLAEFMMDLAGLEFAADHTVTEKKSGSLKRSRPRRRVPANDMVSNEKVPVSR